MSVVSGVLSVGGGILIAWILNTLLANKVEDKSYRIGLKISSYMVCGILGVLFSLVVSLRTVLDTFMENRIEFAGMRLAEIFPNSDILNTNIDTHELASILDELHQTVNSIDTSGDSYFEGLIFDVFLNKLSNYVYAAENGVAAITAMGDEHGLVTIKSLLYHLKTMALETAAPYFFFGQIGILILLIVYIGIYAGMVLFLKKGGALYNKSIVFGDITYDDEDVKSKSKE
jgi:hypothetical protein